MVRADLADDAYDALAAPKRPDESFSELARRLARMAAKDQLFRPSAERPVWSDAEAEDPKRRICRARDESLRPRGARA